MWFDEARVRVWQAGEIAPAGVYVRIDNRSYQRVHLPQEGPIPASFDGKRALYRAAPVPYARDGQEAAHLSG